MRKIRPILSLLLLVACPNLRAEPSLPRRLENPLVLINAQGWAQYDLSIRGSSYTGVGLAINGLNLKVPYSAHFNSELPFAGFQLSPAATQYGLGNASGHLIGTATYTTPQEKHLQMGAKLGTKEHYQAQISAFSSGVGGFLEGEKARQIDLDANNLDRYAGGAQLQYFINDWQIDLIGSGQKKEFGAQGYYGMPTTAYAEQTTEDALVFLGATRGDLSDAYFRASAAGRQFDDEIRGLTPHDVRSRFGAIALEGRTMEIQDIAINVRGDLENEQVDGSVGSHDRTRASLLILPEMRLEKMTLKAGVNSVFQTSEAAEFLPQLGLDWFTTDNSTLYISYSETIQQPDYQTLESNPYLQQQKSRNTELGFHQFTSESFDWRAAAFYRQLENASDWMGGTATDLGTLNIAGIESELSFYPAETLELRAFYQWIHKDNSRTDGRYELDYPEHLLTFSGQWEFAPKFLLFAAQTLRLQTDNDARTSSDFGADAALGLHYLFAQHLRLSLLVDNLWDTNFQPLPGLPPPARTFSAGITAIW